MFGENVHEDSRVLFKEVIDLKQESFIVVTMEISMLLLCEAAAFDVL